MQKINFQEMTVEEAKEYLKNCMNNILENNEEKDE